jgi:enoyl-CoA hydratase/carnithine racemase
MAHLSLSFDGAVAILTLSGPLNNRFGVEVVDDLYNAIDELIAKEARAVLLCADGPDFSHGGDVLPWPNLEAREIKSIFERYMDGFNRLERLPIPVIAAVQGLCNGGGFELALRADILFASESARFCHSEQTVAFITVLAASIATPNERVAFSPISGLLRPNKFPSRWPPSTVSSITSCRTNP